MAAPIAEEFLDVLPAVLRSPHQSLWSTYDAEADVLYIHFKKPSQATDSELTEGDIVVRYEGEEIIGYTVLHARARVEAGKAL